MPLSFKKEKACPTSNKQNKKKNNKREDTMFKNNMSHSSPEAA